MFRAAHRLRPHVAALLACIALAFSAALCPAAAQAPQRDDNFGLWLLRVQYVHRQDPTIDQARLEELTAELDAADTPADKRRIEREIERLESDAQKQRGFVLYGWSVTADDAGTPQTQTRSMSGFMLPATAENVRAMAALDQELQRRGSGGATVAINRAGSKALFTAWGRRWHEAQRAAFLRDPPDIGTPAPFNAPPDRPLTDRDRGIISVSLTHNRTDKRDGGNTGDLHRISIQIAADEPPPDASTLHAWLALRVPVDGTPIGPIIERFEVPRGSSGAFKMMSSSDLIARPGVQVEVKSATAELVAGAWQ